MEEAKDFANTISRRIGFAAGALTMVATIFAVGGWPPFHWWLMVVSVGFMVHSVAYAVIFMINGRPFVPVIWADEPQPIAPLENKQAVLGHARPSQGESVKVEATTAPTAARVTDDQLRLWETGLFRTTGGNILPIPDDVSIDHLIAIRTAVRTGKLHDGMSPNKLDSEKIVSRNIEEPNAYTVVDFLVEAGVLQDNGARKMYTWTETGRRVFGLPSPTGNGYPVNFSRAPEVTRLDPTETTEYATDATDATESEVMYE